MPISLGPEVNILFNESLSKQEMRSFQLTMWHSIVTTEHLLAAVQDLLAAVQVLVLVSVCIFCLNLFLVKAIWELGHTETLLSHLLQKKPRKRNV